MSSPVLWREFVLAFGSIIFLSLPLWPAIAEALWPSDEEPLAISRNQLRDPRGSFKQVAWRYCVMFGLDEPGLLFAWLAQQAGGELAPGVFHFAGGGDLPADFSGTDGIATGTLRLPPAARSGVRLFSTKDLELGPGSEAFEAHAGHLLDLDAGSRLLWWGTGQVVRLGKGAKALGALRAENEIWLGPGAEFLSLRAPRIRSGITSREVADPSEPAPRPRRSVERFVYDVDHEIGEGELIEGDLIVRGDLRIAQGVRIHGSIKAYGTVSLGAGSEVTGSVVAQVGVRIEERATVGGCVLGERWVMLGRASRVGRPGHLATISAETVQLSIGAQAHGMIRAWKGGRVVES